MNKKRYRVAAVGALGLAGLLGMYVAASAQSKPAIDTGPYDVVRNWPQPVHSDWTWGRTGGIWAESPDRIYVLQLGELPALPSRSKPDGTPARNAVASEKETRFEHRLMVMDRNGKLITSWEQHNKLFVWPHSVKVNPYDPERHVWIVDGKSGESAEQVFKFTKDGKLVMSLGEYRVVGNDKNHFGGPTDIAFLPNGDFLVTDGYKNGRVVRFNKDGKYISEFGRKGTGPGEFNVAHSIAIDAQGRIFVSDRENKRIQVFDQSGKFLYQFPGVRSNTLLIAKDQTLWASNSDDKVHEIVKFSLDGKILDRWGTYGAEPGQLWGVHQFSTDAEGNLYTAEVYGGRSQKFRPKPGAPPGRLIGLPFVLPAAR
jgi:peptidylamidoglycolate lyase